MFGGYGLPLPTWLSTQLVEPFEQQRRAAVVWLRRPGLFLPSEACGCSNRFANDCETEQGIVVSGNGGGRGVQTKMRERLHQLHPTGAQSAYRRTLPRGLEQSSSFVGTCAGVRLHIGPDSFVAPDGIKPVGESLSPCETATILSLGVHMLP